ncbi:unnamed protein product [Closterium sp. Yama58-4]|nr:unnamed protein product [Closterium sp. Yama58-4]
MKHVRIYFRHPCAGMLVCFLESGAAPRASLQFPEINITAIPFFSTSVLVCFLVLGAAPNANAQISEVNITAITDFLNELTHSRPALPCPPPPASPCVHAQACSCASSCCVLVCFLVLGAAPKASAQIPEVNITAITDFLNEFFAALHKDVQSSFPGTKLYVLKGKAENTGDYNDVDDDDDSDHEGKLEITKYTYNNITSFKFETQSDKKIKSVTIRKGLPTTFGKVVLVVPGTPAKDDEEYTMTSWIVNASYVAAYNGMSVTSVIDDIYASPYAYYLNMTTSKGWRRGQMYKPLFCFWCDY